MRLPKRGLGALEMGKNTARHAKEQETEAMSTLVRSAKPLPPELLKVGAWRQRIFTEPVYLVLADAYEYNLWYLDENGVPTNTTHVLHEGTVENFLHNSPDTFAAAIVEVLRRRGHNPYERLIEDAVQAGLPESALENLRVYLDRVEWMQMQDRLAPH